MSLFVSTKGLRMRNLSNKITLSAEKIILRKVEKGQ